ncbi:MAG TPA: hypothetical protein VLC09_08025 [Polyangiaceae bacterium]|nr:hypothetical protein [Polyangiaceae bacterium]
MSSRLRRAARIVLVCAAVGLLAHVTLGYFSADLPLFRSLRVL